MNIISYFKWPALTVIVIAVVSSGCGGSDSKKTSGASSASLASISSAQVMSSPASSSTSSLSLASSSAASSVSATFTKVTIASPSLAENLIGEASQRDIWIYLPKAYYSANTPLPVVYYLPGYGDFTMLDVNLPSDMNTRYNTLNPTIWVVIHGVNRFGGSFFVDSLVTGKWSDFIINDVVNYMDSHYRTIPHNRARGIAGHSMGGFGAINLAMRHPEVFSSVFSLAPGLSNEKGLLDMQLFDSETHIKAFIAAMAPIKQLSSANALLALDQARQLYSFDMAYGMAFAPLATPPYFEYPYSLVNNTLVRDEAIFAKWEAGFAAVHSEVTEFKDNLSALEGIGIDCGVNDYYKWIVRGCAYFDAELTAAGIEHSYTTHNGDHQNVLRSRILNVALPFFSQRLAVE